MPVNVKDGHNIGGLGGDRPETLPTATVGGRCLESTPSVFVLLSWRLHWHHTRLMMYSEISGVALKKKIELMFSDTGEIINQEQPRKREQML